ncbi:major facilitator superfamily domain-containing protein [Coniella lustricola]|uniref:Major facilitator superfamily domain-containing protein n=1 Tax=Coniella lustricola TaxID=2025994 RepID=A0A2T3A452_9PEZI|nr:major facilitator superfamily domain-containing protein [Coniella lustricola]
MAELSITTSSYPDRGPAVFAVTVSTLAAGTLFFVARMICRICIVKRVSWDDYIMVVAWVLAAGLTCSIDVGTAYGLGRHDSDIDPEQRLPLRKTEYVFSVLYNPALMALKTSVLVFYLRLARNTQQILRIASWVVLALVLVAGTVLTLLNIFQCRPIAASFSDAYEGQAQCLPLLTEFVCSAPINIVTDLAILALPIPVLTGMRLPKRQKYILVLTFSLGVFVTVVDVVRIYYLQRAITAMYTTQEDDTTDISFGDSPQFAWNASLSLMWSAVEVNIGMICACIPTLKPLIIKIIPAVLLDSDGSPTSSLSTYATESDRTATYQTRNETLRRLSQDDLNMDPTAAQHTPDLPPEMTAVIDLELHEMPATYQDQEVTVAEALAGTAMDDEHPVLPTRSAIAKARSSRRENGVYFGFVNMKRPKSIIETSVGDSIRYCIVVTSLFLLWGFSYGLLNTLNNVIATIGQMSQAETIGLTSAYFGGGYFFGPLIVGEWVLRHDEHSRFHRRRHKHRDPVGGFKATFILGLCIYGTGTIMFWPSAVLVSFPGFLISNFVVGFGLAVLETAANPFIILCGPPMYAEVRILIAQGFQGVATVISGVLSTKLFFVNLIGSTSISPQDLLDVQWTYLSITLFCVALALVFYYMPLPEVRDADLGKSVRHLPVDVKKRSIGGLQLRTICIIFAVFAQWTYVAAQESMSMFLEPLLLAFIPKLPSPSPIGAPSLAISPSDYSLLARAIFAVSRFNAAHIAWYGVKHPQSRFAPSPRSLLTIHTSLSIVSALVCVVLPPSGNPNVIAIPAMIYFFAEGPLWPLIFAIGLRGQGDRTKRAGAWLTMGASGPAFWPFIMYGVIRSGGRIQLAFIVVVVLLVSTLVYPLLLTALRDARDMVDPVYQGKVVNYANGNTFKSNGLQKLRSGENNTSVHTTTSVGQSMRLGRRRSKSGSVATSASGGVVSSLMEKLRSLGKKRDTRGKASSSTTSGSTVCDHRETTGTTGGQHTGIEMTILEGIEASPTVIHQR